MSSIHSRFALAAGLAAVLLLSGCNSSKPVSAAATGKAEMESKGGKESKIAPEFALKDADGKTVRLSDYKGKVVLLDFWATWCGPCKIEIPWFIDFERTYKDKGFAVIGVAMDEEGWTVVKPFISELSINYRILQGTDATASLYGGVDALPTTFLIDRDGKIVATHVGLTGKDDFEDGIKKLMAGKSASVFGRFVPAVLFGAN